MCVSQPQELRHRSSSTTAKDTDDSGDASSNTRNKIIGQFTSKVTSTKQILQKHNTIHAQKYLIAQAGLQNFIQSVTTPLDLSLPNQVKFNMNGCGRMQSWSDVFLAERVYTKCLGISKRIYQMHAFTHEPERKLAYFILEEHNERSLPFLPGFDFYVLVFTYYNEKREVTAVDVQYDQLSFFLHCVGLAQLHAKFMEMVVTPVAVIWAKMYLRTGLVNPLTFLVQLILVPVLLMYYYGFL